MNEMISKITIKCPKCKYPRTVLINSEIFKNSKGGIIAVTVKKEKECQHELIVYIDNNFQIRDKLLIDYKIELPELELTNDYNSDIDYREIDSFIVKLNFLPIELAHVLRGIFLGKKILLISDNNAFINDQLFHFLNCIYQNTFEFIIKSENEQVYRKNKKLYKHYLVIDKERILNEIGNKVFSKKIIIEKKIVHKFFSENDNFLCNFLIRKEITKAFFLVDLIKNHLEKRDKSSNVSTAEINDVIKKTCHIRIDNNYMNFLFEILTNYYGIELPNIANNFLDFIL